MRRDVVWKGKCVLTFRRRCETFALLVTIQRGLCDVTSLVSRFLELRRRVGWGGGGVRHVRLANK